MTSPTVDLWIADEELDQLAESLDRIVRSWPPADQGVRTTFYADYLEVD